MGVQLSEYNPAVMLNTTQRCNYRCSMCFWGVPEKAKSLLDNDPTMTMSMFTKTIKDVAPYCSTLCLAGAGEFLLDPLIKERLPVLQETLINNPDVRFYQTTNASLLSKENLQFLKGVKQVGFTISIDSTDALVYASIRKPGTLSKVLKNILSLRSELGLIGVTDVHIQLNVVVMASNIFSLPDIFHLAKKINAGVFIDHPQGFGPKEHLQQVSLFRFPAFSNDFLDKCSKLAKLLKVDFRKPPPFAITKNEIDEYYKVGAETELFCQQLNTSGPMQILPNGDVSVCCGNLIFGNVNKQSFDEIFNSPLYKVHRDAIATGNPLSPCDSCRFLYRKAPFLYESEIYQLDIPPESRNYEVEPDFTKNGFFEWLDDMTEIRIKEQLKKDYSFKASKLVTTGLSDEIAFMEHQKTISWKLVSWAKDNKRIIIYPAGGQAAEMLSDTAVSLLNIVGFSDRNTEIHGKQFHGYSIFSPEEIIKVKPDVLLIASNMYKEQIFKDLQYLTDGGIEICAL